MYEAGQKVFYGAQGVCSILGFEDRVINRRTITYYVLQPISQPEDRFYVPAHNENAVAKIRPLIDKAYLDQLLQSEQIRENNWIEDENQRKQYYRQLITSLDLEAMIRTIRTLRVKKAQILQEGKKFHLCDENFLRDAKRVLSSELSAVLQIPPQELEEYMHNILE